MLFESGEQLVSRESRIGLESCWRPDLEEGEGCFGSIDGCWCL